MHLMSALLGRAIVALLLPHIPFLIATINTPRGTSVLRSQSLHAVQCCINAVQCAVVYH